MNMKIEFSKNGEGRKNFRAANVQRVHKKLSTNRISVENDERTLMFRCVCVTFEIYSHLRTEKQARKKKSYMTEDHMKIKAST